MKKKNIKILLITLGLLSFNVEKSSASSQNTTTGTNTSNQISNKFQLKQVTPVYDSAGVVVSRTQPTKSTQLNQTQNDDDVVGSSAADMFSKAEKQNQRQESKKQNDDDVVGSSAADMLSKAEEENEQNEKETNEQKKNAARKIQEMFRKHSKTDTSTSSPSVKTSLIAPEEKQPTQLHQTQSEQITNSEEKNTGLYNQQEQKAIMNNGDEYHVNVSNHNPTTTPITGQGDFIGYRENPQYSPGMMGSAKQFEMYGTKLNSKKSKNLTERQRKDAMIDLTFMEKNREQINQKLNSWEESGKLFTSNIEEFRSLLSQILGENNNQASNSTSEKEEREAAAKKIQAIFQAHKNKQSNNKPTRLHI